MMASPSSPQAQGDTPLGDIIAPALFNVEITGKGRSTFWQVASGHGNVQLTCFTRPCPSEEVFAP